MQKELKSGYIYSTSSLDYNDEIYYTMGLDLAFPIIYETIEEAKQAATEYIMFNMGAWDVYSFWYPGDEPHEVTKFLNETDALQGTISEFIIWCENEGLDWNDVLGLYRAQIVTFE